MSHTHAAWTHSIVKAISRPSEGRLTVSPSLVLRDGSSMSEGDLDHLVATAQDFALERGLGFRRQGTAEFDFHGNVPATVIDLELLLLQLFEQVINRICDANYGTTLWFEIHQKNISITS